LLYSDGKIPFVARDNFLGVFLVVVGLFAAVLGLKQAAWEEFRGTYHYLLFRPLARLQVIQAKLIVGVVLVQIAAALLILFYALWAATPGKVGAPFFWSMTVDAWRAWLALPVLYFAAFLSGMRPAKWYATRLVALVVGVSITLVLAWQAWMSLAILGSVAASSLLVACTLYMAAARDY